MTCAALSSVLLAVLLGSANARTIVGFADVINDEIQFAAADPLRLGVDGTAAYGPQVRDCSFALFDAVLSLQLSTHVDMGSTATNLTGRLLYTVRTNDAGMQVPSERRSVSVPP